MTRLHYAVVLTQRGTDDCDIFGFEKREVKKKRRRVEEKLMNRETVRKKKGEIRKAQEGNGRGRAGLWEGWCVDQALGFRSFERPLHFSPKQKTGQASWLSQEHRRKGSPVMGGIDSSERGRKGGREGAWNTLQERLIGQERRRKNMRSEGNDVFVRSHISASLPYLGPCLPQNS